MAKDKPRAAQTAGSPAPSGDPSLDALTYEEAVTQLEELIDRIEAGEIGLEDSIKAYERGVALRARCEAILSQAEQKIADLTPEFEADRRGSPPASRG